MLIGSFAKLLGVSTKTVRHYHALGLLAEPPRAENGYRLYEAGMLVEFRRIQRLQAAGFSLRQIREFQVSSNREPLTTRLLQQQLETVAAEIQSLQRKQQRLIDLLQEENTLSAALASKTLLPVPAMLQEALVKLALPEAFLELDREAFAEMGSFNWSPEEQHLWQDALSSLLNQPDFPWLMAQFVELLEDCGSLTESEFLERVAHLKVSIPSSLRPQAPLHDLAQVIKVHFALLAEQGKFSTQFRQLLRFL